MSQCKHPAINNSSLASEIPRLISENKCVSCRSLRDDISGSECLLWHQRRGPHKNGEVYDARKAFMIMQFYLLCPCRDENLIIRQPCAVETRLTWPQRHCQHIHRANWLLNWRLSITLFTFQFFRTRCWLAKNISNQYFSINFYANAVAGCYARCFVCLIYCWFNLQS